MTKNPSHNEKWYKWGKKLNVGFFKILFCIQSWHKYTNILKELNKDHAFLFHYISWLDPNIFILKLFDTWREHLFYPFSQKSDILMGNFIWLLHIHSDINKISSFVLVYFVISCFKLQKANVDVKQASKNLIVTF